MKVTYKHVIKYNRKGKLAQRLVEPFNILENHQFKEDMRKRFL